jgi:hypothetical protein
VNESNSVALHIAFSAETFHLLLPTWIPGEIVEVDPKYPRGCFVRPLISLTYPHGGVITHLKCADRKGLPLGALSNSRTSQQVAKKEKANNSRICYR